MDPFVYQYAIGGLVFVVGLVYAFRQGYVGLSGRPLLTLLAMVGGLACFAALQGWLEYGDMASRPAVPYDGDPLPDRRIGTPLDYGVMIGYFVAILAVGTFFGRGQKSTKDFFFGGQRFSWWLIAFSLVATTIGSYSFVKYSQIAFQHGTASSQTYFNDWFWLPLLLFGWLPILYFSRITSIPEYFERRFSRRARQVATWLLLVYLVGYVGVNLFTMGTALHHLLGWSIPNAALLVGTISAIYVTFGGQTSVIMTDLLQGVMLLATGLVILVLGMDHLGGADAFWEHLPRGHRTAFGNFNTDPDYNAVGIFWQDAIAGSAMFYFLNQGMAMRFMAARSVREGRRAAASVLLVLMPIAAVVVASGGWVGKALTEAGVLPPDLPADRVFYVTAELLAQPGVFGLIMAALTAALMSTVDTLITAIAAIVVNDVYRPTRPQAPESELLKVARVSSVAVTLIGLALVPVFMSFKSIYAAHGAFTAAVTPPLVVALLFGVFWRRFTPAAAVWTLVAGTAAVAASIVWPELVAPFAHGVPEDPTADGLRQYKFTRALYGLTVCAVIGVAVTLFTRPRALDTLRGLVWGTVADAIRRYKGAPGAETESAWATTAVALRAGDDDPSDPDTGLPLATLTRPLADALAAAPGDLLYVTDARVWLGGLRSAHVKVAAVTDASEPRLDLPQSAWEDAVAPHRATRPFRVKRLY